MSGTIWSTIDPTTTNGTDLATLLDDFKDAVVSGFSGTSRPTNLQAGGYWIDTTNVGSPNFYYSYKFYDGSNNIEIFRVNVSTLKPSFASSDSTFEIKRVADDSTGPILNLIKNRVATSGQVDSGDGLGVLKFWGHTNSGADVLCATIEVVAAENQTSSVSGAYYIIKGTTAGTTTAAEWIRIKDGFLGVGTQTPDALVHAKGATGLKSEYVADNANGAVFVMQKSRIANSGKVLSADALADIQIKSTDDAGTKFVAAEIVSEAMENHTSSARGTKTTIKGVKSTTTTLESKAVIGDEIETVVQLKVNSIKEVSQNVSTTATIAALDASKAVVEMTGSTATDIQGIDSTQNTKTIFIHNRSSASVTLKHENTSASDANRIKLPGSSDILMAGDTSAVLYYCTADTRWKLKAIGIYDPTFGGAAKTSTALSSGHTLSSVDNGKVFFCDSSSAAFTITAYAAAANFSFKVVDTTGSFGTNNVTFARTGGQKIQGVSGNYTLEASYGEWEFTFDGTDWWITG